MSNHGRTTASSPDEVTSSGALLRQPIDGRSRGLLLRAPGPPRSGADRCANDARRPLGLLLGRQKRIARLAAHRGHVPRGRQRIRAPSSDPPRRSVTDRGSPLVWAPVGLVRGCQASSRNETVLDVTTPPAGWSPWPAARAHWGRWGGLSERSLRTTSLNATCGGLCVAATFQLTDAEQ